MSLQFRSKFNCGFANHGCLGCVIQKALYSFGQQESTRQPISLSKCSNWDFWDVQNVQKQHEIHHINSKINNRDNSTTLIIFLCCLYWWSLIFFIVKMQNIYNLIGWISVHNSNIFNCYSANINGMWNARTLSGIYKTFEFILTWNIHVQVQGKSTLNSSKFILFESIKF